MTEHLANADQAASWDGRRGDHWVRYADRYDALAQRLTPHLMEAAAVGASDHVLDVGCGCGLTSRIAARAAREGSVLGIDLYAAMLGEAAVWRPDKPTPTAEAVLADPRYAMYLADWPRPGDYGVVAEQDGVVAEVGAIGAA